MPQQIKGCPFRNMAQQRPGAAAAAAQTIAAVERSIGDSAPLPGEHRAVHETPVVFSKDESAKTDEAAAAVDDDAAMLRKGQPLICWCTALLRPKLITVLHIRLAGVSKKANHCVILQRYRHALHYCAR